MDNANDNQRDRMDFSDDHKQTVDVTIGEHEYELRQATVKAATAYRNAVSNAIEMKDGRPVRVKNVANAHPILLTECLFQKANGKPVTQQFVFNLRDDIHNKLIERLKKISGIQDETDIDKDRLLETGRLVDDMLDHINLPEFDSSNSHNRELAEKIEHLADVLIMDDQKFALHQEQELRTEIKN